MLPRTSKNQNQNQTGRNLKEFLFSDRESKIRIKIDEAGKKAAHMAAQNSPRQNLKFEEQILLSA